MAAPRSTQRWQAEMAQFFADAGGSARTRASRRLDEMFHLDDATAPCRDGRARDSAR